MALAALALVLGTPAEAAEPGARGWWWAGRPSEAFPAQFAPVPPVPEGGLYVGGGPGGPTGVSALRFTIPPDVAPTYLTLVIADVVGAPTLQACPAATEWTPAQGGSWDQRPEAACDKLSVRGELSSGGMTFTFDAARLASPGKSTLDLVLVPGIDASGEPSAFSLALQAPGPNALTLVESAANPAPDSGPVPSFAPLREPAFDFDGSLVVGPFVPSLSLRPSMGVSPPASSARVANVTVVDGLGYPVVMAMPLVMLLLGSYVGWSLVRPIEFGNVFISRPRSDQ